MRDIHVSMSADYIYVYQRPSTRNGERLLPEKADHRCRLSMSINLKWVYVTISDKGFQALVLVSRLDTASMSHQAGLGTSNL
jgi:hypothetical protein